MNLFKTWLAAVLLGSLAVCVMGENLFAQTWQPVRPAEDETAPPNDWQQRVLKRRSSNSNSCSGNLGNRRIIRRHEPAPSIRPSREIRW